MGLTTIKCLVCLSLAAPAALSGGALPDDPGRGVDALLALATLREVPSELVSALLETMEAPNVTERESHACLDAWVNGGFDLLDFLQEAAGSDSIPMGSIGWHFGITRVKVLETLINVGDADTRDWIVSFAQEQLRGRIESREQLSYLGQVLLCVGKTRSDTAIDFLIQVQRKTFWTGDNAPSLDMRPYRKFSSAEENELVVRQLRIVALNAICATGTERALAIMAAGTDIDEDFRAGVDSLFLSAAIARVGMFFPRPGVEQTFRPEKLEEIREIYKAYDKEFHWPYTR